MASPLLPKLSGLLGKHPGGILQQEPVLAFDDHQGVLVMRAAEVDKGRVEVQGIATDHVEETRIVDEDSL